jgi:mono/diheme cytochrome c family protein
MKIAKGALSMADLRRLSGVFFFVLIPIFTFFTALAIAATEPVAGEALFNANCSKCHGLRGTGTDKGPPLVHRIYHPNHHSDLSFHWAVQRGVVAHHWRFGNMPPIKGLTEQDVDLIIKYVRNLQKEAGIF